MSESRISDSIGPGLVALAGAVLWANGVQNGWTMAMIILGVVCAL